MAIIIGLTGGIGSGKSSVMKYIEKLGYEVYYTDDEAKKIMNTKEIIQLVDSIFDENVIQNDGFLNRKRIAEIVFSDSEKLKKLNNIIHPKVAENFENFTANLKENEIVVKESAILFESNSDKNCDYVILITAPIELRLERVMKRDNTSADEVLKRMKNQLSDEEKIKKSDFIINNVDLSKSFEDISMILNKIKENNC